MATWTSRSDECSEPTALKWSLSTDETEGPAKNALAQLTFPKDDTFIRCHTLSILGTFAPTIGPFMSKFRSRALDRLRKDLTLDPPSGP